MIRFFMRIVVNCKYGKLISDYYTILNLVRAV